MRSTFLIALATLASAERIALGRESTALVVREAEALPAELRQCGRVSGPRAVREVEAAGEELI